MVIEFEGPPVSSAHQYEQISRHGGTRRIRTLKFAARIPKRNAIVSMLRQPHFLWCRLLCFGLVLFAPPFEFHTIIAADFGMKSALISTVEQPGNAPGFRFLPYYTFVVENALFGDNHVISSVNNILFLSLFAFSAFLFAAHFTDNRAFAITCALVTVFFLGPTVICERLLAYRQTSVTCDIFRILRADTVGESFFSLGIETHSACPPTPVICFL